MTLAPFFNTLKEIHAMRYYTEEEHESAQGEAFMLGILIGITATFGVGTLAYLATFLF